ncbi:tripartite tricarboxylate transporter substrate binding protein [Granulosicoccaceae sp. 1_MG-2023]|nr:tripartite tricarboxylate transporter substrate binding protein [Granulosicoccaceae sp. 1_MG-2023]
MKKFLVALATVFTLSGAAHAAFPEKDLTLIVPWSAGGGTDTIARALVKNAKKYIGVNVNVVNKTGGQGVVGMGAIKLARPDGYTVGLITFGLSTYKLMGLSDMTFRDFELLQLLNQSAAALSVKADSEWSSLEDLVQYAKANPGKVTLGHTGAGVAWHLSAAALGLAHGVEFNFIPFDGGAPTRSALLGGHIDLAATGIDEVKQLNDAEQIKILAVNADERHPSFPDVPTFTEAGYGLDAPILDWRGLALPKNVPADRVAVLEEGFKKMFEDPDFRQYCEEVGLMLVYEDSEGFEEFLTNMENVLAPTLEATGLLR